MFSTATPIGSGDTDAVSDIYRFDSQTGQLLRVTPGNTPLFPGHPLPEQAWSEMRYTAYSYRMPRFSAP